MVRKHLVLLSHSAPSFLSPFTTSFLLSAKPVTLMSCAQSSRGRWAFHRGLCPSGFGSAFDVVPALTPREQTSGSGSPVPQFRLSQSNYATQIDSCWNWRRWGAPWCCGGPRRCFCAAKGIAVFGWPSRLTTLVEWSGSRQLSTPAREDDSRTWQCVVFWSWKQQLKKASQRAKAALVC